MPVEELRTGQDQSRPPGDRPARRRLSRDRQPDRVRGVRRSAGARRARSPGAGGERAVRRHARGRDRQPGVARGAAAGGLCRPRGRRTDHPRQADPGGGRAGRRLGRRGGGAARPEPALAPRHGAGRSRRDRRRAGRRPAGLPGPAHGADARHRRAPRALGRPARPGGAAGQSQPAALDRGGVRRAGADPAAANGLGRHPASWTGSSPGCAAAAITWRRRRGACCPPSATCLRPWRCSRAARWRGCRAAAPPASACFATLPHAMPPPPRSAARSPAGGWRRAPSAPEA